MFPKYFLQALIILWSGLAFAFEMKTNVKVTEVTNLDLHESYQTTGEVKITQSRDFYAKTSGAITYITNKQGTPVKFGEVIIEIDGRSSKAMHEKALATFASADFTFKKDQKLYEKKLISEDLFKKSKLNYETAKHEFEKTKQEYEGLIITAPFDGNLGATNFYVGDNVISGDYLISITGGGVNEIIAHLPEKLIDKVKSATQVEVLLGNNKNAVGHIIATSPYLSKNSGNFTVKIATSDKGLKHGSFVKLNFLVNEHKGLVIPESAVQKNESGSFVFALSEDKAKQVYITLGTRAGNKVEVLSGLSEGQKVIVEGLTNLNEGAAVKVME